MDEKVLFVHILARHIRKKRQKLDLTLAKLSDMTDIDDKHLGNIELQKKTPSSYTLTKIIAALDLNINAIMNEYLQAEYEKS